MPEFTDASARRISDVVRQQERNLRDKPPPRRPAQILLPIYDAMVTTAFKARSGNTKGTGVVTLYVDDGTGTGNMVSMRPNVTVWNIYAATVAAGKWVKVCVTDGAFSLLGSDC